MVGVCFPLLNLTQARRGKARLPHCETSALESLRPSLLAVYCLLFVTQLQSHHCTSFLWSLTIRHSPFAKPQIINQFCAFCFCGFIIRFICSVLVSMQQFLIRLRQLMRCWSKYGALFRLFIARVDVAGLAFLSAA